MSARSARPLAPVERAVSPSAATTPPIADDDAGHEPPLHNVNSARSRATVVAGKRRRAPRFNFRELLVGASGLVVKQPEMSRAARRREPRTLAPAPMSASLVCGQLIGRVVRVEHDRRGVQCESRQAFIDLVVTELVIGGIDQIARRPLDAIGERSARMGQTEGTQVEPADGERRRLRPARSSEARAVPREAPGSAAAANSREAHALSIPSSDGPVMLISHPGWKNCAKNGSPCTWSQW